MVKSYSIGTVVSFFLNTIQERLYKQNVAKKGPEARLYARTSTSVLQSQEIDQLTLHHAVAMIAGICFASGCFIYAWTSMAILRLWSAHLLTPDPEQPSLGYTGSHLASALQ